MILNGRTGRAQTIDRSIAQVGDWPGCFTWEQRADDAFQVIRSITRDSIMLLGFSDGGYSAYKLAGLHPSLVKRMIVIGASDH